MKRTLAVNTAISAAAHLLIIAALLALSFLSCRSRRRPAEITTFIDLYHSAPPAEAPAQISPLPGPPAPQPQAHRKPKPVEVSRRIVKREAAAPTRALTPEQIRELLAAGAQPTDQPVAETDRFSEYLAQVRAIMYDAWHQPPSLSAASGLVTRARLRVMSDGRVALREIVVGSGNDVMDASVMAALEAVAQLPALPPDRAGHEDITIDFELTRL